MNSNRDKGHRLERRIRKELEDMGFESITTRNGSIVYDNKGVDIIGELPFHVQCKDKQRLESPWKLLDKMPDDKPGCILWTQSERNKKAKKHLDLIIMKKDELWKLLKRFGTEHQK